MNEHPLSEESLFALLDDMGIATQTHDHEPLFTVAQSRELKSHIPGGHTKNLFVKDKKDNYFLIVAEAEATIPMNRIHGLIGARSRLSFANAEALMAMLGVEPGSVNAFAPVNDRENRVTVIIDEPLLANDRINCHPLTNRKTTTISRDDLLRYLDSVGHPPKIIALSQADANQAEKEK